MQDVKEVSDQLTNNMLAAIMVAVIACENQGELTVKQINLGNSIRMAVNMMDESIRYHLAKLPRRYRNDPDADCA